MGLMMCTLSEPLLGDEKPHAMGGAGMTLVVGQVGVISCES
ncbi:MAG: hypothetical protein ACI8UZ_001904 [Akkermansiaceae bacterium]|jgi:hypothetical protein